MAERPIGQGRAIVFLYNAQTKGWVPTELGNAFASVVLYENPTTNTYRIIGRGLQDTNKFVINSPVSKDVNYVKSSDTFHNYADGRATYGINFATKEEAEAFMGTVTGVINKLKSGGQAPAAPPPAPAPKPSPPTPPAAPAAPAAPPAPPSGGPPPPPPAPKAAPPPPPAPAASKPPESGERGALLNSIEGFSLGKLKKAVTVDKSAPILKAEPAAATPSSSGGSSGGGGGLMAEMLAKRKAMGSGASETAAPRATPPVKAAPVVPMKTALAPPTKAAPLVPKPSTPTPPKKPVEEAPRQERTESVSVSSDSSSLSPELKQLKEEILAEVRAELRSLKEEILAAISNR